MGGPYRQRRGALKGSPLQIKKGDTEGRSLQIKGGTEGKSPTDNEGGH